jgi:hypothetical protein
MNIEQLKILKPLLRTNPMFGVFSLGDGSCYFCSACGRRSEGNQPPIIINHKIECGFIAHQQAIAVLKLALQDAGVDGV